MKTMKLTKATKSYRFFIHIALVVVTLSTVQATAHAETLESTNYRIDGATINGGGEIVDSGSGNFSLFASIGSFSGNPRVTSTSYELRSDDPEVFLANTPKVSCFETTSSGSSSCTTGPSYLNTYGMVRVCGSSGCYNRARIEIDTQNNPSDTLYSVQISTDDFATDISVIDGVTMRIKDFDAREVADYLTETAWETPTFNLEGLQSSTLYYVRIVALHGDFTESTPSPSASATTATATIDYDLDITDEAETTPETASPYTLSFTGNFELIAGGAVQPLEDLIWMDLETNASGGAAIVQKGLYGGLDSTDATYTITSATADLAVATEGFGIQNFDWSGTGTYQEDYSGTGGSDLGVISVESNYAGAIHNVGIVDTSFARIYDASGPIDSGRTAMFVRARASSTAGVATDYTETITFVAVGRY